MTLEELRADFIAQGQKPFHALQVYRWLHRGVRSFAEMSDQSKAFRQTLSERYYIAVAEIEQRLVSKLDGTAKYLLRLPDGEHVECVLMEYHHGYSICISSQVGCKMNCSFCATGKSGFSRNLTASEMLAQIQTVQQDQGIRISNVVLMGMGTTVVAAIVSGGVAHIAHAGDSRAYLLTRDGLRQITTDHSMVQELVNSGDLTSQQARRHPQKNIITRALGVESGIEIDYCECKFSGDDLLLLCTDGLTNYVEEEQIERLARELEVRLLPDRLIALAKSGGGGDNVTVAVIRH